METILRLVFELLFLSTVGIGLFFYKPLLRLMGKHGNTFVVINVLNALSIKELLTPYCTSSVAWLSGMILACIIIGIVTKRYKKLK